VGPYASLPEGVGGDPERTGEGVRPTARRPVGVGGEFPLRRTQCCCPACAREEELTGLSGLLQSRARCQKPRQ
jgi:hypothetical protein